MNLSSTRAVATAGCSCGTAQTCNCPDIGAPKGRDIPAQGNALGYLNEDT